MTFWPDLFRHEVIDGSYWTLKFEIAF